MGKSLLSLAAVVAVVLIAMVAATQFKDEKGSDANTNDQVPHADQSGDLLQSAWSWQYTDLGNGERVAAPAGNRFVLTFDEATGRVQSTTDCNGMGGVYVTDGEVLSMGQFVSTQMYCEGSEETVYGGQLQLVNSYTIDGDTLRLNLNRDYGVMIFTRQK